MRIGRASAFFEADGPSMEGNNVGNGSWRGRWGRSVFWVIVVLVVAYVFDARSGNEVVVYSALDSLFSEPILNDYGETAGVKVRTVFDAESTKTVGLTERLISEAAAGNPRCDLFWNNEILNTLRLEREGILDIYVSPTHDTYPSEFRSANDTWHGFAARARVLIVNTDLVPEDQRPTSIHDLADPQWRGRVGIAKPLFGTTATHAACLFAHWGEEAAREYFRKLKQNDVSIESGNKQVALRVAGGQLAFGMTDTDDAMIELEAGRPVATVYPDQQAGGLGTLFIPNTLALIKGSPNSENARRLVDHLLSAEVETRLAKGASAQIPLNLKVETPARVETPQTIRAMSADFDKAADQWETAREFIKAEFTAE